jgi:hypothetical protein
MVAHDRLAKQVNAKVAGLLSQLLINPDFAVIMVLTADRIVSKKKTTPYCAIHHMDDRHFVRRKDFHTCYASHYGTFTAEVNMGDMGVFVF